jgi:putative ABC transport system permease protein
MISRVLRKKLFRDLNAMKMQVFTIALVVGLGVAVLVGFTSTYESLKSAQAQFYAESNFSDLFVAIKRAPNYVIEELKKHPEVLQIEPHLEVEGLLRLPKTDDIASAKLISIPDGTQPVINRIHLIRGNLPASLSLNETVVSEGFFNAQKIELGSTLDVTLNGRRTVLTVVGVATSAEHIIVIAPGSPMPDDFHYAIFWVNQSLLEKRYDMKGAFNRISARIGSAAAGSTQDIVRRLKAELDKFGAVTVTGRDLQISHMYVNEELKQLQVQATILPVIFFLVAAFILNVVISRLIQTQRSEIATLKALGLPDSSISGSFLLTAFVIVTLGNVIGILLGALIGKQMTSLYTVFYRFPILNYSIDYGWVLFSFGLTLLIAALALASALRAVFKLEPAEAMRPPAPPVFQAFGFEKIRWFRSLDPRSKMTFRGLFSFPMKSTLSATGLSFTIVLLVSGLFWNDSMDHLVFAQYGLAQRETGSIQLMQPLNEKAVTEVYSLSGVTEAEGYRIAAVEVRLGEITKRTSIRAFPETARLQTLVDENLNHLPLPLEGVFLSRILAKQLGANIGDIIDVEFLEGRRESFRIKVERIIDSFMSMELITSRHHLSTLLKEPDLVNSILFRSIGDPGPFYVELKEKPQVLGITFKDSALKVFEDTSAKYILIFATILSVFAGAIGFGVAFNNLQITLSERDWEFATLQIMGFHQTETFRMLTAEIVTLLLISIPVGWLGGWGLAIWLLEKMSMESFQIPFVMRPGTFLFAAAILIFSTALSAGFIWMRLRRMDTIATLKSRG